MIQIPPLFPVPFGAVTGAMPVWDGSQFQPTSIAQPTLIARASTQINAVAINVDGSDEAHMATLVSQSATLTAGKTYRLLAWINLLNNSGSGRTYTFYFGVGDFDSVDTLIAPTTASLTASGTNEAVVIWDGIIVVKTSSSCSITGAMHRTATFSSGGGSTSTPQLSWYRGSDNITGSQTIKLKGNSTSTSATQTATVLDWFLYEL